MRETLFAICLLVGAAAVAVGAFQFAEGAGLIVGGLLFAGWSWLVLGDAS